MARGLQWHCNREAASGGPGKGILTVHGSVRRSAVARLAALLVALSAAPASADGINGLGFLVGVVDGPQMQITDQMIQARIDAGLMTLTENANGTLTLSGGTWTMPGVWEFSLNAMTFDPDPFVSQVGGLTNLGGVAADFFITTSIPVVPVVPSSLIGGSSVLTYGDANFSGTGGLTNPTGGASGYAGLIDGAEVLPLLAAFSLTPLFPGDATQSVSGVAGLPGPTIPGPAAALTIGITNRFNLSSLDQATWNSTFIVEPIPEPGTGILLGLGLLAVGVVRRRGARH